MSSLTAWQFPDRRYDNLDVGEYEILVAGRENINYNVSYKKYEANTSGDANAVTVEKKALTIETGSYDARSVSPAVP